MLWWVLGGLVALVVGFLAFLQIKFAMHERHVRANGRPVLGVLLRANQTLFDPDGDPETAAFAVIGFERLTPEYLDTLRRVAKRVVELDSDPEASHLSEEEREFAVDMQRLNHTQGRRRRVPDEATQGDSFYVVDVWLHRDRLLDGWEEHRALACIATGREEGEIVHVDSNEEDARALFEAAGVV